jgi:outer membrane protein assembly factor BamB
MHRLATTLILLLFASFAFAADWPAFRGPDFDGAVREVRLFEGADPALSVGWSVEIGSGYSAPVVGNGQVAVMFADADADYLAAFDVASGEERWRYRISDTYAGHDGSHDGPIATPTIAGDRIYGLGAWGHLFAVDAASGREIWVTHLVDDVGAEKPWYGFTSSPRLVDGVLIVLLSQIPADPDDPAEEQSEPKPRKPMAVGGFDPATGEPLWIVGDDHIEYQSVTPATLAGVPQVLAAGKSRLYSLEARSGRILWSFDHSGDDRAMGGLAIVPVVAGEGRVFLMNKIDSSVMLQVAKDGEHWEVSELWSNGSLARSYVQPVYHGGSLYGMNNRIFTCIDAATGEIAWRSREPGDGFPIVVGDHLVMMTKPGSLHVIDASPAGYHEVASIELFEEHSWSESVFAEGYLFARSMARLTRIDPGAIPDTGEERNAWFAATVLGRFLTGLEGEGDKAAAIDAFLAAHPDTPIVRDDGTAHFLYRGDAQDVGIVGDMIGYRREDPMTRVPGTDLFHYTTRLEPTAASTYGFIPDFGDPVPDPRNPRKASGLFGDVSWFAMPAWDAPDFLDETPAAMRGRLESVEWDSAVYEGKPRKAEVYLPMGYDASDARYPTVYVHFGKQALEQGAIKQALDHLLGARVRPLIAVFVHADEENPRDDINDDKYAEMVVGELLPKIDVTYRTIAEASARASVGSGRCANRALKFGFERPDLFGRVGAQSALTGVNEFADLSEKGADVRPLVIYMDWGTYHMRSPHEAWSVVENNRNVWAAFRAAGYRPAGGEVPEGFGWPMWAGHFDDLLVALFPPES